MWGWREVHAGPAPLTREGEAEGQEATGPQHPEGEGSALWSSVPTAAEEARLPDSEVLWPRGPPGRLSDPALLASEAQGRRRLAAGFPREGRSHVPGSPQEAPEVGQERGASIVHTRASPVTGERRAPPVGCRDSRQPPPSASQEIGRAHV